MKELEIIYRYFTSGLPETEQQDFNDRLRSDAGFSEKVADYKIIFEGFAAIRFNHFLQKVQDWRDTLEVPGNTASPSLEQSAKAPAEIEELQNLRLGFKAIQAKKFHNKVRSEWAPGLPQLPTQTTKEGKGKKMRLLWYAAAAVLLLAVGYVGMKWYADQNYRTEVLVQQHYTPRKTPSTLAESSDPFQRGFNAYQEHDFPNAIDFFSRVPSGNSRYPEAQLFLAYTYFEDEQFAQAEQSFKNVIETGDERFSDNAEWHLLLSLMEQPNKHADFLSMLNAIVDRPRHSFHEEALNLKAALNSFWRKLVKDWPPLTIFQNQ